MVEYSTIVVPENPSACVEAIGLLSRIFGETEGRLEEEQLFGKELPFNTDVLFTAKEDGLLLGTCHLTIPHSFAPIGGLSGLCTSEEARGRGVGKNLFRMAVEEADARLVQTLFLGTSNPMAASLYMQFGFSFVTGSNVMVRCTRKFLSDFYQDSYSPSPVTYVEGDASFRIPVIPLVLSRGRDLLMDANTAIFSSAAVTQPSCMGLYPRYIDLMANGGSFFGARHASGALCAMASRMPTPAGTRLDAFAFPGFEPELPGLVSCLPTPAEDGYAQIATADTAKESMFAALGFQPETCVDFSVSVFKVSSRIWRKPFQSIKTN
jgi:GNAT superfamily N-acetyltransferase